MKSGWSTKPRLPAVAKTSSGVGLAACCTGSIALDEADFAGATGCSPLQAASAEAYRRIFRLLDAEQVPHSVARLELPRWHQPGNARPGTLPAVQRRPPGRFPRMPSRRHRQRAGGLRHRSGRRAAFHRLHGWFDTGHGRRESPPGQRLQLPGRLRPTQPDLFAGGAGHAARAGNPVRFRHGQHRRPPDRAPGRCRRPVPRSDGQRCRRSRRSQPARAIGPVPDRRPGLPGLPAPGNRFRRRARGAGPDARPAAPTVCIRGDICRSDLLVEIEATASRDLETTR
jgi:hypothetical protein